MRLQAKHAIMEAAESCRALHDEWQATVPLLKSLSELTRRAQCHCVPVSSRIACMRRARMEGSVAPTMSSCMPSRARKALGWHLCLAMGSINAGISDHASAIRCSRSASAHTQSQHATHSTFIQC
jgi:hypothetical protein